MGLRRLAVAVAVLSACARSGASLVVEIHGSGSVTSTPAGLRCPGDLCTLDGAPGMQVTLTATGDADSELAGWTGACTGSAPTCTVELTSATTLATATFVPRSSSLAVLFTGGGSGSVASAPAGIACTADCSAAVPAGTSVALTAMAAPDSVFVGWSGGCTGSAPTCTTTIGATLDTVTARFEPASANLTVDVEGQGTVTGGGLACPGACAASVAYGTTVLLTATPADGWRFDHWTGACAGTGPCQITLDAPATVGAEFTQLFGTLSIVVDGVGHGDVVATSSACPGGTCADCPDLGCEAALGDGATVTLTASADSASTFAGWSSPCAGTGTCTVTIDGLTIVRAAFALQPEPLTVELTGAGSGNVRAPGLVDCGDGGSTCSATVTADTPVTLTATAAAGSRFVGWSGPCDLATPTCEVTLHEATTVTAQFALVEHSLWVVVPTIYELDGGMLVAAPSQGRVIGTVGGSTVLDCSVGSCSVSVPPGTQVTLTGTPVAGASLTWDAPCSGSAPCTVTVDADIGIDALFTPVPVGMVNIDISQPSSGDAVALYSGSTLIGTCPSGGCTYFIQTGAQIDLEADADPDDADYFEQWNGPCYSTIPDCPFTVEDATNAQAVFADPP